MPTRKGPGKEKGKGKAPAPKQPSARPREPDPYSGSEDEGQLVMARILSRLDALESRKKATRGEGSKAVGKQGARKAGNQPNKQLQLLQSIEVRLDALESGEGEATGSMENASRNTLDADVRSFDGQAPPFPLRILIYGHSYVFWASRRAQQTSLVTQLGLAGAAEVEWMGCRGMLWNLFLPFLGKAAEELGEFELTREDVINCLEKLKINKSPGPDGFHPRVLKELKCKIADLLAKIYNSSLQSDSVPEDWKVASVTPVFKKGSRRDP
ncbi:uncharacterized protein LOC128349017 isoform X3 [Hemicordylus capensis]|uniref:uncharacterized protein LOC128349017 isoform X3 n=1 Tax=Hemicordylus capensis TaxID=884348 RepID=UPI002302EE63|nr:uncharacterized protein LOC128349017 isoform X3 [Hemicordylus capensis]